MVKNDEWLLPFTGFVTPMQICVDGEEHRKLFPAILQFNKSCIPSNYWNKIVGEKNEQHA